MKLTTTTLAMIAAALLATAAHASVPGVGDPLPRDVAEAAKEGFATTGVQGVGEVAEFFIPRDRATMGDAGDITVSTFSDAAEIDAARPSDPTLFR